MNRHEDTSPLSEADWNAMRQDEPDPAAVERAYLRFKSSTRKPTSDLRLGRWLLAGVFSGVSVVSAATGYRWVAATRSVSTLAPSVATSAAPAHPSRLRVVPSAPPSPRVIDSAKVTEVPHLAPRPVQATFPSVPDALARDAKWQDVARALEARDHARAETALAALENGGTTPDREAASLALAQVLIANGRAGEAHARLERLSASAHSELVRQKAETLLGEMGAQRHRSTGAPEATK